MNNKPKFTESQLKNMLEDFSGRKCKQKAIDVRDVFDEDDVQLWYSLDLFPGYQYSNKGYVRRITRRKSTPYGVIVPYRKTSNGKVYNLKNLNGIQVTIRESELKSIVEGNPDKEPFYTYELDEIDFNELEKVREEYRISSGHSKKKINNVEDIIDKLLYEEDEIYIIKPITFQGE